MANSNTSPSSSLSFSFIQLVKLDRMNYLVWKTQVLASIIENGFEGFINGDMPCLAQFLLESIGESSRYEVIATRPTKNPNILCGRRLISYFRARCPD